MCCRLQQGASEPHAEVVLLCRAFMQERIHQQGSGTQLGQCVLYFGCRRSDQDYLYGQQLQRWADQGLLTLFTAFSRQQVSYMCTAFIVATPNVLAKTENMLASCWPSCVGWLVELRFGHFQSRRGYVGLASGHNKAIFSRCASLAAGTKSVCTR